MSWQNKNCIKCLGKTPEQYEMMQDPDIMWFCVPCRKVIERSIEVEKQIEEKCKEIKSMYEDRLTEIEAKLDTKVNETDVKRIAKEVFQEEIKLNPELKQITKTTIGETLQEIQVEAPAVLVAQNDKSDEENITRSVVNEINEQRLGREILSCTACPNQLLPVRRTGPQKRSSEWSR